ncbi:MAG: hypothetical protein PHE77_00635 [Candidatus Pacebacteria bacterium]|nr:hypothetical protein [Candidatus Paceibacterota bacterium]
MKPWKIISIILVCAGFAGFLFYGYWFKANRDLSAQEFIPGQSEVICEEPIPVGNAIDTTVDFLDEIYQLYQGDTIKSASKQMDALVTALNQDNQVCNFDKCTAQVESGGPDATIEAKPLPGLPGKSYTYSVPLCKLKEATGNPCPDIAQFIGTGKDTSLADLANKLVTQADNVHALFEGKTAVVPLGLEQAGEVPGQTAISKADLVKRYIDSVERDWFTPSPLKNTCALSELDRQRIAQGKMGQKYPMQCLDALSKDMYTPKAWSEECKSECETFSEKCKQCLAKCEGTSVYATLNCKIYSTGNQPAGDSKCYECVNDPVKGTVCDAQACKDWGEGCTWGKQFSVSVNDTCYQKQEGLGENDKCATFKGQSKKCCGQYCADGLNTQCKECLCEGLNQEQCLAWICGGSTSNWVCCHEEPIQNPQYYIANQTFATGGDVESYISPTGEKVYRITAGKQLTFAQAYGLFKSLTESYMSDMDPIFLLANAYRESRFILEAGKCTVNDSKTKITDDNRNALQKIAQELGLDYTLVPLSCAGSVGSGGAMGPAQFMPTTWWNIKQTNVGYKFKVEKTIGEEPANPWDFRDAFLASALYLHDEGARKGNEESEKSAVQA